MDKKRRNEIAWAVLVDIIGKEETKLGSLRREIGNRALRLKIPQDELRVFTGELLATYVE